MNDPKRSLDQNMRNIDREKTRLEKEKQKKLALIKQLALKGDHTQAKMLAKEIQVIDNQIKAMGNFNGQIRGVQSKVTGLNSMNVMANTMETTSQVMSKANQRLDMQKMSQNANVFQKQDMKLNMKQDMMDDIFDSMGGEAVDEDLYNQVLNDAGIKSKQQQQVKPVHNDSEVDKMLNEMLKEQSQVIGKQQQPQQKQKYAI